MTQTTWNRERSKIPTKVTKVLWKTGKTIQALRYLPVHQWFRRWFCVAAVHLIHDLSQMPFSSTFKAMLISNSGSFMYAVSFIHIHPCWPIGSNRRKTFALCQAPNQNPSILRPVNMIHVEWKNMEILSLKATTGASTFAKRLGSWKGLNTVWRGDDQWVKLVWFDLALAWMLLIVLLSLLAAFSNVLSL